MIKLNNYRENLSTLMQRNNQQMEEGISFMSKWEFISCPAALDNTYIEDVNYLSAMLKNNMDTVYNLVLTCVATNDSCDYLYGICVLQNENIVDYALGLSRDYDEVASLVELCNKEKLHIIHFRDVVEDFFGAS